MELRQLRYFIAVAEELNFRRAALRLNISQPPLSMQIKSLEAEIGASLFERSRRIVKLTRMGEFLLTHARAAVTQFDDTVQLARLAARGEAGRLRLGFTASVPMQDLYPMILRQFRVRYPHVSLEVLHIPTGSQLDMLSNGRLDVGFLRPSHPWRPRAGIEFVEMWRDRLELFVPFGHALSASMDPVGVEELAKERFVTFERQTGCGLFEHVSTLCGQEGFVPNVAQKSRDGSAILGFVAAGAGIAILPAIYSRAGVAGVVQRRLRSTEADSRIALACSEEPTSDLVSRFLEVAVEVRDRDRTHLKAA